MPLKGFFVSFVVSKKGPGFCRLIVVLLLCSFCVFRLFVFFVCFLFALFVFVCFCFVFVCLLFVVVLGGVLHISSATFLS